MNAYSYMKTFVESIAANSGFGNLSVPALTNLFSPVYTDPVAYANLKEFHELEYVYSSLRKEREERTDDEEVLFRQVETRLNSLVPWVENALRIGYAKWLAVHTFYAMNENSRSFFRDSETGETTSFLFENGKLSYTECGITLDLTLVLEQYLRYYSRTSTQEELINGLLSIIPEHRDLYRTFHDIWHNEFSKLVPEVDQALAQLSIAKRQQIFPILLLPNYDHKLITGMLYWYDKLLYPRSLRSRIINISLALNYAHHSGKMGGYIGISQEQLEALSNLPVKPRRDHRYLKKLSMGIYERRKL